MAVASSSAARCYRQLAPYTFKAHSEIKQSDFLPAASIASSNILSVMAAALSLDILAKRLSLRLMTRGRLWRKCSEEVTEVRDRAVSSLTAPSNGAGSQGMKPAEGRGRSLSLPRTMSLF